MRHHYQQDLIERQARRLARLHRCNNYDAGRFCGAKLTDAEHGSLCPRHFAEAMEKGRAIAV